MVVSKKNFILRGIHNKPILADVFYKDNNYPKPVLIFCHGYKGFKDWGAWDLVANSFAEAGFFFVKFNFSHNGGTIEQPIDFPDLEAFANNNYVKELDDLTSIIDWVTTTNFEYANQLDVTSITLIGHSRGGGIATIKSAEDSRITRLITWASVSDYGNRFPKGEAFKQWQEKGVYFVENGRTKQQMPHYFQFYTCFKDHEERLTISRAATKLRIPHLIIHGTKDPTVDVQEAKSLHQSNPNSELYLVPLADHVFGAKHPWNEQTLPEDLETTVKKSIEFALL